MIGILDYGLGNIAAFANIMRKLEVPHVVASGKAQLDGVTKLILPGVGAFDHAMNQFDKSGMRAVVDKLVLGKGVPVLGVCVGMQMMANGSEEGVAKGLGWIGGEVRKFDLASMPAGTLLPHMGWNDVVSEAPDPLLAGLEQEARFYFLHSYYFAPGDRAHAIGSTAYGAPFCCIVRRDNVIGVQFHPEKSHRFGVRLLKNFAEL